MPDPTLGQVRQIWSTLDQGNQQQIVEQFRQTIKDMIHEHFRIDPASTSQSQSDDLREAVESEPSHHQQGEPTHAVRAA